MRHTPANNIVDISVIIVNYRSWKHLKNCLESLKKIEQDEFSFEVIIVDNNSNDNQLNHFLDNFPDFKFVQNTGNYGFSNGNNLGESIAKGTFLLFLNPDTIVSTHALNVLIKQAKEYDDYGIMACTKLNNDGKPEKEIRFFPKLSTLLGISRVLHRLANKQRINLKYSTDKLTVFPDWVSGSIIFMSRKWFEKINGWNEDYWLYLEDVDLCKRITNAGGKVALTRQTHIIHNHGGASRLNVKTAALTKAEVIISKHVYINTHFKGASKICAQIILFFSVCITKLVLAFLGLILFFIPKLFLNTLLFRNIILYYFNVCVHRTWMSKRAPNYNR
ncbi:hypothetical protein MHTCC0001_14660 [Flavobacteriaceae bacterium MHTCC 0001]